MASKLDYPKRHAGLFRPAPGAKPARKTKPAPARKTKQKRKA